MRKQQQQGMCACNGSVTFVGFIFYVKLKKKQQLLLDILIFRVGGGNSTLLFLLQFNTFVNVFTNCINLFEVGEKKSIKPFMTR